MGQHLDDEQPAGLEAKLREEADRVVRHLEAALAAAPDDPELRGKLQRILDHARRLRQQVEDAIVSACAESEGGAHA